VDRHLEWEGCFNARDLGGLPTVDGGVTRAGAVVRADSLDRLSPAGWAALRGHGIRTVLDLRNDDERTASPGRHGEVDVVHVPLDDIGDAGFWDAWAGGPQFGTPLYYRPFLECKPERCAAAVAAVAGTRPGGVVVHCGGGRDRTGLVTMLLLALVGVGPEDIASDYELSYRRMPGYYAARGEEDYGPVLREFLAGQGITARAAVLATLASLDVEATLRAAGLRDEDVAALRARLVEPAART
jgi:protein-tyrosine phosphatase